MDELTISDCQIDAKYSWRPEFEDNEPRLRVAVFDDRITVTSFDDASEGVTEATTLFAGPASSNWRDIVRSILKSESFHSANPCWPESFSIVVPSDLHFSSPPNTAQKLVALVWLGSEWTQAVEYLLDFADDQIVQLDKRADLLSFMQTASSETSVAFMTPSVDLSAEEFFHFLIGAAVSGEPLQDTAQRLIAEHWE
ncbi:hypothetical protein [Ruegeria arenilitoris]|uniref:hypothetical protein n=1 Tax=Ruegeria arenilitoris TaxID=1173585 RepID=UPI00147A4C03|nr:hypothetical protein [Ruegeria arenilitoris]